MLRGLVIGLGLLAASCAPATDGFRPLDHWRGAGGTALPATWTIVSNEIDHVPGGGDIETVELFADFELDFDWRISPGGNSGVFYRVAPDARAAYLSGPEYQILDNFGHPDGRDPLTSAASAYAITPPSADMTRPVGEWNAARIVVAGNHVEHWLNGTRVLDYNLGSPDWRQRVAASKFRGTPYGRASEGRIVLQDHGAAVAYRNLRIRPID